MKPEQVVLSHSPMHMYKDWNLLEKFVLVLGQQNIHLTAKSYPCIFQELITMNIHSHFRNGGVNIKYFILHTSTPYLLKKSQQV